MFSKKLITLRMDRLRQHYPWLSSGLDYFTGRLTQAPEDADFALAWVVKHAKTREQQDLAHAALRAKCDILWAQLDALYFSYVQPGWPPPGAFRPAERRDPDEHRSRKPPAPRPGCRMNEKTQQPRTLLMPERALRLNGRSLEIVERCDGQHTVQEIIAELQQLYSKAEPAKVGQDILGYLALLQKERALDFEP